MSERHNLHYALAAGHATSHARALGGKQLASSAPTPATSTGDHQCLLEEPLKKQSSQSSEIRVSDSRGEGRGIQVADGSIELGST